MRDAMSPTGGRDGFAFTRIGRFWNFERYAVYDDGGPYCLSWQRVKAKDVPKLRAEVLRRGWVEVTK